MNASFPSNADETPRVRAQATRLWRRLASGPRLTFLASALLTSLVLQLNPGGFETRYGTGDGRFEDRVDSWSDRIVINTILDDAFRTTPRSSRFPLVTKGYPREFSYYPDGGWSYLSQAAGHVHFLSGLAALLHLRSDAPLARFIHDVKAVVVVLTAVMLALFVARIHAEYGLVAGVLAALVVASSVGFTLYAHNLYVLVPMLLLPFAIVTVGYGRLSTRALLLLLFVAATLNFLCRYEFATTYAVLSTLPLFVFRRDDPVRPKLVLAVLAGSVAVAGSLVAFGIHLALLAREQGGLAGAVHFMLGRGSEHALSLMHEVARPFTSAFFTEMRRRYAFSGVELPFTRVAIDQSAFLLLYLLSPLAVRPFDRRVLLPWGVGLFAYVSWYVFAYHHVMFGYFYDWLPYAMGLIPGFAAVLAFAFRGAGRRALVPVGAAMGLAVVANFAPITREEIPPPPPPPAGARLVVAAEPWSAPPWSRGISVEKGTTQTFVMLDRGNGEGLIAPGTRLYFQGTGFATATQVRHEQPKDMPPLLYVTVDRNLWPERDGSPSPISVY